MAWDEFEDFAADTVVLEPFAARDGYGNATYGDAKELRARVEYGDRRVTGPQGEEIVSTRRIFVGAAVTPDDRITLPADATMPQPQILRVEAVRDENGPHHWVIYT